MGAGNKILYTVCFTKHHNHCPSQISKMDYFANNKNRRAISFVLSILSVLSKLCWAPYLESLQSKSLWCASTKLYFLSRSSSLWHHRCLFCPDPSQASPSLACPFSGHQMQSLFFGSLFVLSLFFLSLDKISFSF